MAQNTKSLLDLSTQAPDRQFITIDGVKVYLATAEDLSVEAHLLIERTIARFNEAQKAGAVGVTDEDAVAIAADVRASAKAVLIDAPDDAFDKLKDGQLVAIIRSFSEAVGPTKAPSPAKRKTRAAGSK